MASRSSDPARSTCISSTPRTRPAASARRASSPDGAASAGLVAAMIALRIPSATSCVGVIEMSVIPTASRPSRNSVMLRAPAMQPAYEPRSKRSAGDRRSSATMSEMPMRPPGRRTRAISRKTDGLSAARFTTQLLITTSIESAGSGIASMWPLRNSTLVAFASAALRWASASISSVMSSPKARPVGPTRLADNRTSIPPPDPRSRTRSPSRRSATAVGLPQPSDARTAASGSSLRSSAEYSSEPIGFVPRSTAIAARRPDGGGGVVLADGLVDGFGRCAVDDHRFLLAIA